MGTAVGAAVLLALALARAAQALTAGRHPYPYQVFGDRIIDHEHYNSKPGTAKILDWRRPPLYWGGDERRGELGMRLSRTADAQEVMHICKRFLSIGDYTWCSQAMPRVSHTAQMTVYAEHEYVLPQAMKERQPETPPDSMLALSFGLARPDVWSEIMSNKFSLKTHLYDCHYQPPIHLHDNHSEDAPCTSKGCYNMEYHVEKSCLDDSQNKTFTAHGLRYIPLSQALEGRGQLSTFVKLDVSGAEWKTLEWLMAHEEEIMKIRTLDVRYYAARDLTPDGASIDALTRHIEIMDRMRQTFVVVGSTVEGDVELQRAMLEDVPPKDPYKEPLIHTQGGLTLEQCTISYVNRRLLHGTAA